MFYFYLTEITLIFAFGLVVGSVISFVSFRLEKGMKLQGRPICPHCKRELMKRDIVPLFSYILLGGRCRFCKKKISWRYPVLEIATGVIFVALAIQNLYIHGGFDVTLYRDFFVVIWLILIFDFDLNNYLIPDKISLPAIFSVLAINTLLGADTTNMFWGIVIAGGFFLGQYLISDGKWIGGGDIRLGILMGIILGWAEVIIALGVAYLLGAVVSLLLLAVKRKKLSGQLPFGTFLTVATLIIMFAGEWVLNLYR